MSELNKEYQSFIQDLEKNIKNKEDLDYIKERFSSFLNIVVEQMDNTIKFKQDKIEELEARQQDMENRMNRIQEIVDHIEEDIYSEDGFDFEIVCPYCNYQFVIDIDENKTEVECPECNNTIELDWTGDLDEDENACNGNCSHCSGCDDEEEEEIKPKKEQNEDDM